MGGRGGRQGGGRGRFRSALRTRLLRSPVMRAIAALPELIGVLLRMASAHDVVEGRVVGLRRGRRVKGRGSRASLGYRLALGPPSASAVASAGAGLAGPAELGAPVSPRSDEAVVTRHASTRRTSLNLCGFFDSNVYNPPQSVVAMGGARGALVRVAQVILSRERGEQRRRQGQFLPGSTYP